MNSQQYDVFLLIFILLSFLSRENCNIHNHNMTFTFKYNINTLKAKLNFEISL